VDCDGNNIKEQFNDDSVRREREKAIEIKTM